MKTDDSIKTAINSMNYTFYKNIGFFYLQKDKHDSIVALINVLKIIDQYEKHIQPEFNSETTNTSSVNNVQNNWFDIDNSIFRDTHVDPVTGTLKYEKSGNDDYSIIVEYLILNYELHFGRMIYKLLNCNETDFENFTKKSNNSNPIPKKQALLTYLCKEYFEIIYQKYKVDAVKYSKFYTSPYISFFSSPDTNRDESDVVQLKLAFIFTAMTSIRFQNADFTDDLLHAITTYFINNDHTITTAIHNENSWYGLMMTVLSPFINLANMSTMSKMVTSMKKRRPKTTIALEWLLIAALIDYAWFLLTGKSVGSLLFQKLKKKIHTITSNSKQFYHGGKINRKTTNFTNINSNSFLQFTRLSRKKRNKKTIKL